MRLNEEIRQRGNARGLFILYFDGLCEPVNPGGIATFGLVIQKAGHKVYEESGLAQADPWSKYSSNNVAEYSGLIRGLEWLKDNNHLYDSILVRGDSKLVINQLNGNFKVKSTRLVELYQKAKHLISAFTEIKFEWIERSLNSEADILSRVAYARYTKAHPREM